MSLFGRKTFKAGPVRVTASKSGLSSSVGSKKVRVRANTKGRKTVSANPMKGVRITKSKKF